MSAIEVSDSTQRKLDELAGDREVEDVLWRAIHLYERSQDPSE